MVTRLIIGFFANLAALFVAKYFVAGLTVTQDLAGLAIVVILFTIANSLILPMLRVIFKPLSWLTLGIFPLLLNGVLIYVVDFLSESITINGLLPLIYTTVIFGIVNAFFSLGATAFKDK